MQLENWTHKPLSVFEVLHHDSTSLYNRKSQNAFLSPAVVVSSISINIGWNGMCLFVDIRQTLTHV